MIVLDASAMLELLLGTDRGQVIGSRIADPGLSMHAPHLLDVEIVQALRRYLRDGEISSATAKTALEDLRSLDVERHAHEPLLERVWALRENLTSYDAVYVALSEVLDAPLLTCDGRLSRAPGIRARVELVSGSP
jgi:predicted nucleic acid-binding protein